MPALGLATLAATSLVMMMALRTRRPILDVSAHKIILINIKISNNMVETTFQCRL